MTDSCLLSSWSRDPLDYPHAVGTFPTRSVQQQALWCGGMTAPNATVSVGTLRTLVRCVWGPPGNSLHLLGMMNLQSCFPWSEEIPSFSWSLLRQAVFRQGRFWPGVKVSLKAIKKTTINF